MDEQDKKPLDAENMSDEELENLSEEEMEEIVGGFTGPPVDHKTELPKFLANGGTFKEYMQIQTQRVRDGGHPGKRHRRVTKFRF